MALTPLQAAASIAVMAAVTFLTRFIPFLLFDRPGKVPHIVLYLGRVLPPAIIMMLVIYCLRRHLLLLRQPRHPGACVRGRGGGAALVERQQPAVHLFGHDPLYDPGTSSIILQTGRGTLFCTLCSAAPYILA